MRLYFRGNYEKFRDEQSQTICHEKDYGALMRWAVYSLIILAAFLVVLYVRELVTGGPTPHLIGNRWALLFVLISIPIHELLHVVALPRKTTVYVFYSGRFPGFVGITTDACVARRRAVLCVALPAVVLGLIPFVTYLSFYTVIAEQTASFLLTFSVFSTLGSAGDMEELFRILKKPKGAKIPMS